MQTDRKVRVHVSVALETQKTLKEKQENKAQEIEANKEERQKKT